MLNKMIRQELIRGRGFVALAKNTKQVASGLRCHCVEVHKSSNVLNTLINKTVPYGKVVIVYTGELERGEYYV
jgi:hypothetical protein